MKALHGRAAWPLAAALLVASLTQAQTGTAARPELVVRSTDFGQFFTLAVSPDGKWYAAVNKDGHVSIVSTKDGFEYRNFQARATNFIYASISVSADSKTLALPTGQNTDGKSHILRVDVATAKELPDVVFGNGWAVNAVAYHPQEDILAAQTNEDVYVLRAATGEVLFKGKAADDLPRLHFSPDGHLLAAVSRGELHVWSWKEQKELWHGDAHGLHSANLGRTLAFPDFFDNNKMKSHSAESLGFFNIVDAAFSPDGRSVAVMHQDEVNIFSSMDGRKSLTLPLDWLKNGEARSVLFLDGHRVYAGTLKTALILDTATHTETEYPAAYNNAVFIVPHSNNLLINLGGNVGIRGIDPGPWVSFVQSRLAAPLGSMGFSPDGADLFAGVNGVMNLSDWKMDSGQLDTKSVIGNDPQKFAQSPDGRYLAYYHADGFPNDTLHVWDRRAAREAKVLTVGLGGNNDSLAFSADGKWLASISGEHKELRLWSLPSFTPAQVKDLSVFTEGVGYDGNLAFSPHSDLLAVTAKNNLDVYSLTQPVTRVQHIPVATENETVLFGGQTRVYHPANRSNSVVSFSPDGKRLVVLGDNNAHLFDTTAWTETGTIPNTFFRCVTFSPDSSKVALVTTHDATPKADTDANIYRLTLWDIEANKAVFATDNVTCGVSFNKDGSLLAAGLPSGLGLFRPTDGTLLASLYRFQKGGPIMDDDAPDWLAVTPDGLFDGTPAAWGALSWRFDGNTFDVQPVETYFREFFRPDLLGQIARGEQPTAATNIATLDRRQPSLQLAAGETPALDVSAPIEADHVHLQVSYSESREKVKGTVGGSGVRDLRLFRNGTLVKIWRGDLKLDANGTAQVPADVPIVAGENKFTAYAFNHDNIKSPDATLTVKGSAKLRRQGTAYVLAIGINRYAVAAKDPTVNLTYAEADAGDFADTFSADQGALGQFAGVKIVRLFSEDATKANILAALAVLGGAPQDKLSDAQRSLLKPLDAVRPEDGVFMYYSGHGNATAQHFYFLPTDYNPAFEPTSPQSQAISEEMLGTAIETISPARSFLVIDACKSGKALENLGKAAVGPLNSTGLAQVAYEKGLDILAAAKATEKSRETSVLSHGYLTYALVDEGLKSASAAQDGVVELLPWFEFAGRRVPQLPRVLLERLDKAAGTVPTPEEMDEVDQFVQHPRVFYRREPEATPFVVAKPSQAATAPSTGS